MARIETTECGGESSRNQGASHVGHSQYTEEPPFRLERFFEEQNTACQFEKRHHGDYWPINGRDDSRRSTGRSRSGRDAPEAFTSLMRRVGLVCL